MTNGAKESTVRGEDEFPVSGKDFLIFSTQDWDALPTRKHRFARGWAENGNRVLYVEQQMHWAGWLVDLRHQLSRVWRWLKGPRQVAPNLWIATLPIVLPFFQMSQAINWLNNVILLPILRRWQRRLGFKHPILWTYTPHSGNFIDRLGEQAAVYECVDDFTSSRGLVSPKVIARLEQQVIDKVDVLIVTAPALVKSKGANAKRVELVPNGVDADHFALASDPATETASAIADLPHPIIGFLGSMNYWIDTDLLSQIARKHPEWTVAHVGPRDLLANTAPLDGLPNYAAIGRVPYDSVPTYVKAFDVCVNPYVLDGVAEHCSPLKLYEYVATGKHVVSVDMPEAHTFEGLISIAHNTNEFIAMVEDSVSHDDGLSKKRQSAAQNHTWGMRFERVVSIVAEVLGENAP